MENIRKKLLASINSDSILEIATQLYQEDWENNSDIGKELAVLHNQEKLNILATFLRLKNDSGSPYFFATRSIMEDALPTLIAPVKDVMECVKHLTIEAGQDMTAGMIFTPFMNFCEKDVQRSRDVLELAVSNPEDWKSFIAPAIIAGARNQLKNYVDIASELSMHQTTDISVNAISALSRIDYGDDIECIDLTIKTLKTLLKGNPGDKTSALITNAAISAFKADKNKMLEILEILTIALRDAGDHTLYAASQILVYDNELIPDSFTELLLTASEHVNPEHIATLNNLDYCFEDLVRQRQSHLAIKLIESWLTRYGDDFPLAKLDSFSREIMNNQDGVLDRVVTRWLLSDRIIFNKSIVELLKNNLDNSSKLKVDIKQLDKKNERQILCLAKRACGWFFFHPVCAVSYMVSLISEATADQTQEIGNTIFNPLMISYPESIKSHLNEVAVDTDKKTKVFAEDLLQELAEYHDGLRSTHKLHELKLPVAHREAYSRKLNKTINSTDTEVSESSFLSNIFGKPSVVLYGSGSINYIQNGPNGETSRQEMKFQSISTSIEYPMLQNLDPHGLERMLFSFKSERYDL